MPPDFWNCLGDPQVHTCPALLYTPGTVLHQECTLVLGHLGMFWGLSLCGVWLQVGLHSAKDGASCHPLIWLGLLFALLVRADEVCGCCGALHPADLSAA